MLTYFLDTIKTHFPNAYFRFQSQPSKAIKSLFISCGFAFILFYFFRFPGSLLLQTALGHAPISWKLLADMFYVLVTPFMINAFFSRNFKTQTVKECRSYVREFQESDSEERKEKLVEQFVTSLFFSPEYMEYQFKLIFKDDPALFGQSKSVAKKKLLAFFQSSVSLDKAIQRYSKIFKDEYFLLVEYCLNDSIHLSLSALKNESDQSSFFEYCKQYIKKHYCPVIVASFGPDHQQAVISFIRENIEEEELNEAFQINKKCDQIFAEFKNYASKEEQKEEEKENQEEDQKKYIREFANALFVSPEDFSSKLVEDLSNIQSFEGNAAAIKKEFLSYCAQSRSLEKAIQWYAKESTSAFVMWNIDTQLDLFLEDADQTRTEFIQLVREHIKEHFKPSAFKACLEHSVRAVELFVKKFEAEALGALSQKNIFYLNEYSIDFQNSSNIEEQKEIIKSMILAIFVSPEKFAEQFFEHLRSTDEPATNKDEVIDEIKKEFLRFCQNSSFSSLSEAIREYAQCGLDGTIMLTLSRKIDIFQQRLDEKYRFQFSELFEEYVKTEFGVAASKTHISHFEAVINSFIESIKEEAEEALRQGQEDMRAEFGDQNYYEILGIDSSASESDVKKAYHKKAIKDHPDKNPNDDKAHQRFANVKAAYEFLSDPEKRAGLDAELAKNESVFFQFKRSKAPQDETPLGPRQRSGPSGGKL